MTDKLDINPNHPHITLQDKVLGKNILNTPAKALTTRNTTAWTTAASPGTFLTNANTTRLDNMDQRILDIENVLIKLGLLRHK